MFLGVLLKECVTVIVRRLFKEMFKSISNGICEGRVLKSLCKGNKRNFKGCSRFFF